MTDAIVGFGMGKGYQGAAGGIIELSGSVPPWPGVGLCEWYYSFSCVIVRTVDSDPSINSFVLGGPTCYASCRTDHCWWACADSLTKGLGAEIGRIFSENTGIAHLMCVFGGVNAKPPSQPPQLGAAGDMTTSMRDCGELLRCCVDADLTLLPSKHEIFFGKAKAFPPTFTLWGRRKRCWVSEASIP